MREALTRVVAEGRYQQGLPAPSAPRRTGEPGPPSPIVELLLTVLGGAIAVAVLAALVGIALRAVRTRRPGAAIGEPAATPQPAHAPAPVVSDLDARARAGDLDTAIRELLHRVLGWLVARQPALRPASLTSREVLAASDLPAPSALALRELVDAVERAVFAGRPASADDWARCHAAFTRLQRSLEAPG